ncbi:MAG TPA: AAA family ATPase [Candidatus Angelobacter sp.]|jgi:chromosome partitioning protein|nr:AAA family ATPase [Candidatus Angelobacter sp.]
MIVLCGGIKGGIGKTTVATNLTVIRANKLGAGKVVLIDSDPQESAYKFTQLRNEVNGDAGYHCFKLTGKPVRSEGLGLSAKYQDVIIDAGVGDSFGQRAAMTIADVMVLPFRPSSYDIWTLASLVQLVDEMQDVNPKLRVIAFLNQADHVGHDNAEAAEMLKEATNVTLIDAALGYRKAFRNTAAGKSVTELMPQDMKATAEMLKLYRAIFDTRKMHPDVTKNHSERKAG